MPIDWARDVISHDIILHQGLLVHYRRIEIATRNIIVTILIIIISNTNITIIIIIIIIVTCKKMLEVFDATY